MPGYVTQEQLDQLRSELGDQYTQLRKLVDAQAIAIDRKITALDQRLEVFVNKRMDPSMITAAWVRQIPKIRQELQLLRLEVARLKPKGVPVNG